MNEHCRHRPRARHAPARGYVGGVWKRRREGPARGDKLEAALQQIGYALGYYVALVVIMRLAGKRLAGQTTTFDLVVLIGLSVALQQIALQRGLVNTALFIATVFSVHWALAAACARSSWLRRLVRGAPRPLVRHGQVMHDALADEGLSYADLLAGLRKLGFEGPDKVALATLEETGHISAVAEPNST